jgi:hypothetical protein
MIRAYPKKLNIELISKSNLMQGLQNHIRVMKSGGQMFQTPHSAFINIECRKKLYLLVR